MKHGDFTELAKHYVNRPNYSLLALKVILDQVKDCFGLEEITVADVGAGTGKLTENLAAMDLKGFAVEPNAAMREEGIKALQGAPFTWSEGAAEVTGLGENSVHWVLMGSSFHWADAPVALEEFHRILKPGGYFTAIWNPRDLEKNELHQRIEEKIAQMIPNMKRVSSGSSKNMSGMEATMLSTPYFSDIFFVEAPHVEVMSKERYMGVWASVNDIQVQAGPDKFREIMEMIEEEISEMDEIIVPYKSRAWTVKAK